MNLNKGFTLIEVLIVLLISSFVMLGLSLFFQSQQKSSVVQTDVSDMQQTLRASMDFIIRDIRMVGYDPNFGGKFGFLDIDFRDYDGAKSLSGDGFLQFARDSDGDGILDGDEVISYSLWDKSDAAPDSIALMRELASGGGRQPIAGNIINMEFAFAIDEDSDGRLDRNLPINGKVMWLADTDGDGKWDNLDVNGDGVVSESDYGGSGGMITGSATGIPVNTKHIRAVRVWLLARSPALDINFIDRETYIVGRKVVQPNDHFRHRLLERMVFCRNAGLGL